MRLKEFARYVQNHQELSDIIGAARMTDQDISLLAANWRLLTDNERDIMISEMDRLIDSERQQNTLVGHS